MDINEMEESLRLLEDEERKNQQTYEEKHPKEFKTKETKRSEWRNSDQKEARRLQAARYRERYSSIRKEAKRLEAIEMQKLGFLPTERSNIAKIKVKKLVEVPVNETIRKKREEIYFAKIDAELMTEDIKIETAEELLQQEENYFSNLDQELFKLAKELKE
jgi:hypothetical protein